jgi:adenosylhomocysteine nucleosidase
MLSGMTLAIVSALPDELAALQARLDVDTVQTLAGRQLHRGRLAGREVLLVLSGIGKVAAATTAALLLDRFAVSGLLFTGVAGGLGPGVQVGDVVVADQLLQHDMDASPLFPRWEVPGTGRSHFAADAALADRLAQAAAQVLAQPLPALASFGIATPRAHRGLIVSGDRFVASQAESTRLQQDLPQALAVEMEGAAVAQVCHDFGRPFAVLRTISDRADDQAHVDFPRFLAQVAAEYSRDIVLAALA